ncbi:TPA: queuosine precursor transporter [Candidatus Woesearchaeota archaeon]|nr:MAG: hypothetical protein QT04_C0044G0021 [archaeon GW2011_AR11]HIH05462.1 queuosine precursor transporter [Candidatus Woesearchaeota archaeon]HIH91785.1 queuosine precursor transporter [Candidatus Woesearchaeota archaeon]HII65043.1 queuosine precursor transporter [Candidatus Woesearchaeota archaeon]
MENELLSILSGLLIFAGILVFYRLFGRAGLFIWMGMAIIIANIQVMETIAVFGFVTAMGNIIYGTTFLITDILTENYGKKDARKAVVIGFAVMFFFTALMQLTLRLVPDASDTMHPALVQVFSILPRITFASLTAYLLSQFFDVWLFCRIREATRGRHLWLRNNLATMLSQLIDNAAFTAIAFVGFFGLFGWGQVFEWSIIVQIFVTSLAIKYVVAICDTPFVYLAVWMKKKGMVPDT